MASVKQLPGKGGAGGRAGFVLSKEFYEFYGWLAANMTRFGLKLAMSWKKQAQRLQKEAHVFYFLFKHPRTRWYAKLLAVCTAGYLFSPIQLIPSCIPLIGFLDDLLVLFLGAKLLQKITPPDLLNECRELAQAAETRRKEEVASMPAIIASVAIGMVWIFAAIASAMFAAYIYH